MDVLEHTPAQVADDLLTVRRAESCRAKPAGRLDRVARYGSNVTWRWFADPASRDGNDPAQHERIGRPYAGSLRAGSRSVRRVTGPGSAASPNS
ncbi:hypothetical protein [Actinoplanes xinjiangensis]|uniref:hypothetical protein n=1 Tax=Actinoplanes xinjiangensis TaxID=512350 RepID=UPI0011B53AC1|nr:hypothetical protein [Actinoplanes xinjiangensis]GIF42920.1 hypothetical protein Axi01nite_72310 [Actinoplanes xinjiangensis]